MLVTRLTGSIIYYAYSHAIQSARKPLVSDLAKFVKHTRVCCMQVSSLNQEVLSAYLTASRPHITLMCLVLRHSAITKFEVTYSTYVPDRVILIWCS